MNTSPEDKEKRRKALERRKKDKQKRRNPIAGDYSRFRHMIHESDDKKRGGASNWRLNILKESNDGDG